MLLSRVVKKPVDRGLGSIHRLPGGPAPVTGAWPSTTTRDSVL